MSRYQQNPLQTVAIWAGLALIGLPLALPLAASSLFLSALALISWLAFCVAMRAVGRWLGWRTALLQAVLLLGGVPLAILLLSLTNTLNFPAYLDSYRGPVFLIICWFLAFWSLLSGLFTRNERGIYVAIHLSNWFFCLGIIGTLGGGWQLLSIPLGITLLLLGLTKPILQMLAFLPFLRKNRQSNAVPKSAVHQNYEQGYQPAYEEGGNVFTYPAGQVAPGAYSPRAEMQQQQ